jgi:hypothetical protein
MFKSYRVILPLLALILALSVVGMAACSGGKTETTSKPPTTPVDEKKANITGNLAAVRVSKGTSYEWEMDIKIAAAGDVIGFANPVKGTEGQTITAKTHKYMLGFTLGQGISAVITQVTDQYGTYLVVSDING